MRMGKRRGRCAPDAVLVAFMLMLGVTTWAPAGSAQDSAQSVYLRASALIREGEFVGARDLLQKLLLDYPADEIALRADERLGAILVLARDQERERVFASGPGLYVMWKDGRVEALPAFLMTENDVGAETRDADLGIMRCLSERTPYRSLVLTDIDRLVVRLADPDHAAYRLEKVTSWFPYHYARDLGPLQGVVREAGFVDVDLGSLAGIPTDDEGSRRHRGGISVPRQLAPGAEFVNQETGSWGGHPGPVRQAIWTFDVLVDHREELQLAATGNGAADLAAAREAARRYPGDLSIDLHLAELAAQTGDAQGFSLAVDGYRERARAHSDARHMSTAGDLTARADAILILENYVAVRDSLVATPELVAELTHFGSDLGLPAAHYLLSCAQAAAGDLEAAVRAARAAEEAVRDDAPRLWYCGLVAGDGTSRDAARAAKRIFKSQREALDVRRKVAARGSGSRPE